MKGNKPLNFVYRFSLLLCFVFGFAEIKAQNIEIKGSVSDKANMPLIGATVVVKGTTNGTITDIEGNYSIQANVGEVLTISYVGYVTTEILVSTQEKPLNIILEEDMTALSEVVVVGYGVVKKSDLTGSVASVKINSIKDIPANSIDGLLQGRAAGLQVMNTSQDPGAGAVIRIRGNSSLNGSNTPLVVVNGFPLGDAGNLSQIDPADIVSIEVLKDASATAIYGSRGANGVIMVTTKTASAGTTNISFRHQTTIGQFSSELDLWRDPLLMAQVANEEQVNAGLSPIYTGQYVNGVYYPSLLEIQEGKWSNTDWAKVALRTPIQNNTTLSLNGAGEKASFNINLNHFDDQGVFKKDGYSKTNINMGVKYKIAKDLSISASNIISFNKRNISNTLQYGRNPLWPVYDENGDYYRASANDYGHPLIALNSIKNKNEGRDFIPMIATDWGIVEGLKLHSQLNYQYTTNVADVYMASTTSLDANADKGIAQLNSTADQKVLSETYLTYNKLFNEKHNVTFMVGHSYGNNTFRGIYTTARGFVNDAIGNENMGAGDPAKRNIDNTYVNSQLLSYYSRLNYALADKYLVTLTMRADGSSKFGKNNKWGYFPSGAFSWKMQEEDFIRSMNVFDELKLRVSYGISGNQGISPYQTLDRYGKENYWSGGSWQTAIGPGYEVGRVGANNRYIVWSGISNPDLKWESTRQFNIGTDVAILNDRVRLTFDYYDKHTSNLLREKYLPLSSSYDKIWVNDGEISNKGFEFTLNGDIVRNQNLNFSATLIYSQNRNKVVSLGDAISSGLSQDYLTGMQYEVSGPALAMFNQNISIYAVGQPMNVFYGYKTNGIIQNDEDPGFISVSGKDQPGEFKYMDLNGDYEISEKDRIIIGDPNPDFMASMNLVLGWKRFDMSVFFNGVFGNDVVFNGMTYSPKVKTKRWTEDNPTNQYPSLNANRSNLFSDYFIQDGSFVRIQNVTLGYKLDSKKLPFKSIRIFSVISNLYTFSKFGGYDPEVGLDGVYWGGYPKLRKYTFGVDFTF